MTDFELLTLAAKAVGYPVQRSRLDDPLWRDFLLDRPSPDGQLVTAWNPLTNDGDAFRLAVDLEMTVLPCLARDGDGQLSIGSGTDKHAATRCAIVECAAKIGKQK